MYNDPHYDEEKYRLKRKDDKGERGPGFGWVFGPAIIGMGLAFILTAVLPSLAASIAKKAKFSRMLDNLAKDLGEELTLIGDMKWGETNLWLYLLIGAALGIIAKYFYSDGKVE